MSGSALAPWAVVSDPARATLQVASTLNCTEEQLQAQLQQKNGEAGGSGRKRGRNAIGPDPSLLGCLRSVPLYQLMRAARMRTPSEQDYSISQPIKYIWGPSLDGVVVHSFKRRMRDYLDRMARYYYHLFSFSNIFSKSVGNAFEDRYVFSLEAGIKIRVVVVRESLRLLKICKKVDVFIAKLRKYPFSYQNPGGKKRSRRRKTASFL